MDSINKRKYWIRLKKFNSLTKKIEHNLKDFNELVVGWNEGKPLFSNNVPFIVSQITLLIFIMSLWIHKLIIILLTLINICQQINWIKKSHKFEL